MNNHSLTIGIYGVASQSGRAYFADYLSKGYSVIGYNRQSEHGNKVINAINKLKGINLERPANSNNEDSRFIKMKTGDAATSDISKLVLESDIIIIALPSIYHEDAVKTLCEAGIWKLRTPIVLSPSRSFASPYLWRILGKNYPIVCFSTCPYSCKAPDETTSLIKRRKRTWIASLEGDFSNAQTQLLRTLFPQAALTDIPALTSLNNIGAVFHCATYILNKEEIDFRKDNGQIFSFYMDGIANSPDVGKILEDIDQIRLQIASKLGLSVFGLKDNAREDIWRKLTNGLRALEVENENDIDVLRKIRALFMEYLNNSVISAQHWLDITYGVQRIEGESLSEAIGRTPTYQKNSVPQLRYVSEDIPTGLVVYEALAKIFAIDCSVISSIINQYNYLYSIDARAQGRNLSGFSNDEIIQYLTGTELKTHEEKEKISNILLAL